MKKKFETALKSILLLLVITCLSGHFSFAIDPEKESREILLRLPLLSDKNATVIAEALDTIPGIEKVEACFELKVMIVGYDSSIIEDDAVIIDIINKQRINTKAEKIYSSDIPLIRSKYKTTILSCPIEVKN